MEEVEAIAVHEAGHALMFDALGVPIELVTVVPSDVLKFDGHIRLASESNNVVAVLAGTMAGPAASFYIVRDLSPESHKKFASDQKLIQDMHEAEEDIEPFDRVWQRIQFFMQSWLQGWILAHQGPIRNFASALVKAKTLSGPALGEALGTAWDGGRPDPDALRKELLAALAAQGLVKQDKV
jgi:hypothetical protein